MDGCVKIAASIACYDQDDAMPERSRITV